MGHRWIGWFELVLGLALIGLGLVFMIGDFTSPHGQGIGFAYGAGMVVVSVVVLRAGILLLRGSTSGRRASIAVMKLFISMIAVSLLPIIQGVFGGHRPDVRELLWAFILMLLGAAFIYSWICLNRSTR